MKNLTTMRKIFLFTALTMALATAVAGNRPADATAEKEMGAYDSLIIHQPGNLLLGKLVRPLHQLQSLVESLVVHRFVLVHITLLLLI